jgi:putative FmdB family regulatory protein
LPLYAYRCTQCGHSFEKIQNFSDEQELVCPKCGGVLERPLTAPRLQFKGAGWYVNDYASKSSAPAGESGASETKAASSEPASTESKKSGDSAASAPATVPSSPPSTSGTSSSSGGTSS